MEETQVVMSRARDQSTRSHIWSAHSPSSNDFTWHWLSQAWSFGIRRGPISNVSVQSTMLHWQRKTGSLEVLSA